MKNNPNDVFNRVGPGTAMGDLFRRFWLPALLSEQAVEQDGSPVRLRILGEDLVAFRDSSGKIGIVGAYCRHRLAPLYFGRNEECGLRCIYHGWKWNADGDCVDIPNIPQAANIEQLKEKARIKSYPAVERGGMVWVYMGPEDKQPPIPNFEWLNLPEGHVYVASWIHHSNWHLPMEGEIDSSHISFLHSSKPDPDSPTAGLQQHMLLDGAPEITLRETDYGYVYGSRRKYGDQYYWRVTQWMLPMWSAIPGSTEFFSGNGRGWVPIDDQTTMAYCYMYNPDRPLTPEELKLAKSGAIFPPRTEYRPVELHDGYVIDAYDTVANKGNDYLIDREMQKSKNYSGIWGISEQDRALIESMAWRSPDQSGMVDTSQEMLVKSDFSIMTARRILAKLASDLEKGIEPAPAQGGDVGVRAISIVSPIADFDELMEKHADLGKAQVTSKATVTA